MTTYKRKEIIRALPLLLALLLLLCSCTQGVTQTPALIDEPAQASTFTEEPPISASPDEPLSAEAEPPPSESITPTPALTAPAEPLRVIIMDVGQGDCILVTVGEHAMLIDAGNAGQEKLILGCLSDNGVTKLDYVVATHPHADHIGSMPEIIRAMDSISTLLMPDIIHTTKTFENLLDAIEDNNLTVTISEPGGTFLMGQARIQIIAPNSAGYSDLNNYSIALRIEYGQIAFLFTGDAEDISESEQLASGYTLSADVLKIGHHGSNSSSTQRYLDAVSPSWAVISVGNNNSYGHPHTDTLSRLAALGVTLYRTDKNGTITFTTDGYTITAETERVAGTKNETAPAPSSSQANTAQYIGNKNSKIFHKPTCGTLPAEKNRVYFSSRDDAVSSQYRACQRCNP